MDDDSCLVKYIEIVPCDNSADCSEIPNFKFSLSPVKVEVDGVTEHKISSDNDNVVKHCITSAVHDGENTDDVKDDDVLRSLLASHSYNDVVDETFSNAWETVRVQQMGDDTETQNTHDQMFCKSKRTRRCHVCHKGFPFPSQLKRHELTHTDVKPYCCDICHKRFTQLCSLKSHKRIHSGERPYYCGVCTKTFKSSSELAAHRITHTNYCDICHKRFDHLAQLKEHKLSHVCGVYMNAFDVPAGHLSRHMPTHSNVMSYSCDVYCKKNIEPSLIQAHKYSHTNNKRIHSGETPEVEAPGTSHQLQDTAVPFVLYKTHEDDVSSVIDERRQQTNVLSSLAISSVHDGENTDDMKDNDDVLCSPLSIHSYDVGETFSNARQTVGVRQMGDDTGAQYTQDQIFNGSKRRRRSEKKYCCSICQKAFPSPSALKMHNRTHTKEKPHSCCICLSQFSQLGNLKRHELIHRHEKDDSCHLESQRLENIMRV